MKRYNITVNGNAYDVTVEEAEAGASAPVAAAPAAAKPAAPKKPAATGAAGSIKVESPMPGSIVAIKVNVGDKVAKGQALAVLEAMKMENDISSPADGVVASINVSKGESINTGSLIATLNA